MHRERRLLLAHTGWATVVDSSTGSRDEWESTVLGAIGPGGQSPIPAVRPAVAAADAVRALAQRLVDRGLAVSESGRREIAAGVRAVRAAFLLSLALGTAAALLVPGAERAPVVAAFALPLLACGLCLLIGRVEVYPYTRWASPPGSGCSPASPPPIRSPRSRPAAPPSWSRSSARHSGDTLRYACRRGKKGPEMTPVRRASCAPHPEPDPVSLDGRAMKTPAV